MIFKLSTYHLRALRIKPMLTLLFAVVLSTSALAQQDGPPREFTNPDEMVTLSSGNTFTEVVGIFNQLAQEFESKFIVDRTGFTGAIGLDLPPMHWKDALNFILDYQGFALEDNETYYELVIPSPDLVLGPGGVPATAAVNPNAPSSNLASLQTREIRISATFFSGNKRALQEIGVDWSTLSNDVPVNIQDFISEDGNEIIPATDFTNDQWVNVNSIGARNVSQNVFNSVINFGEIGDSQISVQALFSAFQADNLGEILATPFATVIDGQEANLQVGQDFSIKQRDFAGNVTDAFFNTGTILTVTPTIIVDDSTEFIYLDINVERSSAIPDPVSTIINKETYTTKSLLLNGESTVLAGLYRSEESRVRRGVPILKDIPILGYLFGFNSKDINENELIILISAELVKSLPERIADKRIKSKNEILTEAKERNRNDMDYVPPTVEEILPAMADAIIPAVDSTVTAPDSVTVDTTTVATDPITEDPIVDTETEQLTPEQQELAKELSLPVENPELMVVIPRAFDLDKFLEAKETGIEIPVDNEGLKYFVIGGSFIVRKNAYAFQDGLKEAGFETRMLYNTRSRFHFVAYQGYSNFDAAVGELQRLRQTENRDAWLFIKEGDETEFKNGAGVN